MTSFNCVHTAGATSSLINTPTLCPSQGSFTRWNTSHLLPLFSKTYPHNRPPLFFLALYSPVSALGSFYVPSPCYYKWVCSSSLHPPGSHTFMHPQWLWLNLLTIKVEGYANFYNAQRHARSLMLWFISHVPKCAAPTCCLWWLYMSSNPFNICTGFYTALRLAQPGCNMVCLCFPPPSPLLTQQ